MRSANTDDSGEEDEESSEDDDESSSEDEASSVEEDEAYEKEEDGTWEYAVWNIMSADKDVTWSGLQNLEWQWKTSSG